MERRQRRWGGCGGGIGSAAEPVCAGRAAIALLQSQQRLLRLPLQLGALLACLQRVHCTLVVCGGASVGARVWKRREEIGDILRARLRGTSRLPRRILDAAVGAATALLLGGSTREARHITGKLQVWGRFRKVEEVLERGATSCVQPKQDVVQVCLRAAGMLRCLCTDRSDGPDIAGYDVDKGVTRRPLDEGESLAAVELIIRATHDLGDRYPREGGRVVLRHEAAGGGFQRTNTAKSQSAT